MARMKAYASFDDYLEGQSPKNQAIIRALREFVKRVEPGLSEAVKWGNGCWVGKKGPVAYVYSDTGYVQFGFFYGSSLKDPKGLLEGKGKRLLEFHRQALATASRTVELLPLAWRLVEQALLMAPRSVLGALRKLKVMR